MPHLNFKKFKRTNPVIYNQPPSNPLRKTETKDFTHELSRMTESIVSTRKNETHHYASFFRGKNHWLEKVRYWCKSYFT